MDWFKQGREQGSSHPVHRRRGQEEGGPRPVARTKADSAQRGLRRRCGRPDLGEMKKSADQKKVVTLQAWLGEAAMLRVP
mmetsp:Transcript_77831/g.207963  ORF Transcript_77831/g.207963 Transcript_77831/m.207963 type:complete len:80 (+) Transcript_77831:173-412(+)